MEIIMPIGISGSGKSRLYKKRYSHMELVSPDLIRKELTGSFNNFHKDNEVYEMTNKKIDELVKNGKSFFFDNVNIHTEPRKLLTNKYKGTDIKITYVVLPADFDLSLKRIYDDLKNNVERGYVSAFFLAMQYGLYKYSLHTKFEGENVQEIIYLKPGDLD